MPSDIVSPATNCGEQVPALRELYGLSHVLRSRTASDDGRLTIDIPVPNSAHFVIPIVVGAEQRPSKYVFRVNIKRWSSHVWVLS
jgi:hypothetical protein